MRVNAASNSAAAAVTVTAKYPRRVVLTSAGTQSGVHTLTGTTSNAPIAVSDVSGTNGLVGADTVAVTYSTTATATFSVGT